ncbi:MAG: hypothetical protein QXX56_01240 [Candidatus Bathyarchaeia archaeon]
MSGEKRLEKLEKVRGEMGVLERIASYVPGYRGYKEKELRRESDRLVRMETVNKLRVAKDALRRKLVDPALLQKISSENTWAIDSLMSRLDRIIQRLDRAVAGYAGMFDSIKVREDKLDAVLQLDLELIEKADSLKTSAEVFIKTAPGGNEWGQCINNLILKIEEIEGLIDRRVEIFRGLIG